MQLAGKVHTTMKCVQWPGIPGGITLTDWAVCMNFEGGYLHKNDLLQWLERDENRVGFALGFARSSSTRVCQHLAVVQQCRKLSETSFQRQRESISFLQASAIVGSVPFASEGDVVLPLLHTIHR